MDLKIWNLKKSNLKNVWIWWKNWIEKRFEFVGKFELKKCFNLMEILNWKKMFEFKNV